MMNPGCGALGGAIITQYTSQEINFSQTETIVANAAVATCTETLTTTQAVDIPMWKDGASGRISWDFYTDSESKFNDNDNSDPELDTEDITEDITLDIVCDLVNLEKWEMPNGV